MSNEANAIKFDNTEVNKSIENASPSVMALARALECNAAAIERNAEAVVSVAKIFGNIGSVSASVNYCSFYTSTNKADEIQPKCESDAPDVDVEEANQDKDSECCHDEDEDYQDE